MEAKPIWGAFDRGDEMDDILVDDTKLDGEEVIGIDQENDNNVGVGSSGLVKGSVNHDIPINHGPTPINV